MAEDASNLPRAKKLAAIWESGRNKSRLWSYYLSGTAVFLLGLQVMTGALLLLHYQPNVREAHKSVAAIATEIPSGWVVRSVHHTSANLLVIAVILHALRVLLSKTFRAKRAATYYTGVLLLWAVLFMCFTGYLLPWDSLSVSATAVATGLPGEIPFIGPLITDFFRAGASVGSATLSRFFGFHVSLIPMALALGLGFHILCIRRHSMRRPAGPGHKRLRFFPDFLLRQSMVCLWIFALLLTWALLSPTGLRPEGDPLAPAVEGIRPEWYFLGAYQAIKWGANLTFLSGLGISAELMTLILMAAVSGPMIVMPLLDKRGRGRIWKGFVLAAAGTFVVLTVVPMAASQAQGQTLPEVTQRLSDLSARTIAYLVPFWLTVLALTWFLSRVIRLCDRISAFGLPGQAPKT